MKHLSKVALDQHCDWRLIDGSRRCAPDRGKAVTDLKSTMFAAYNKG